MSSSITESVVREALSHVQDPEIGRPITELNMVKSVDIEGNDVTVGVYLTIAGCPMKSTIETNTRAAVEDIDGVGKVTVTMDAMSDEQRRELKQKLRGGQAEPEIPFAKPDSTTRVFAVASGKGGVGKSSMTVNLAAALADKGLKVGIVDADIYGHSVPSLLGSTDGPTVLDDEMLLPPISHGIKHISIGQFVEGNAPVVWRGPMLHRALQQFLADVFWGDLDVLLLDLPPGTGDVALSVAQLIPNAELLIVTTPQAAAAEVAERAGSISQQTRQRVAGVIENMSAMVMPDGSTMDVFGEGGGQIVADRLGVILGHEVPLLASVPLDPALRSNSDAGTPIVLEAPDSPAAKEIRAVADQLAIRSDSLVGKSLNLGVN
ncbi:MULTISPECIES: Mrp/NBP35 family ATP-binding protein [Corynebacterium]|jgi:mrp ATPase family protein|uniref:Mrp/NBP35 family ATP-binding protein n=1 Tax=Corynebacterium TaxID=1716 RepID=UPI001EF4E46E|nr:MULTISPECIES: Mrp/NBP35 family ATP-binding protein [Corynebacterium]MCG7242192.1 Mrp/NBP35 family ATP-binding protein [Corynebacterium sp. ACRPS]MDK8472965.1 Mrp/NBP35 family ATP-binding protein [Corynebacterium sp. MSK078]MDK8658401.1 Mrp/NBP35 family ATP-binding protein [Corynebacterium sp. MSK204]MDK8815116.1 Mrp/NBP35 family ATP-binding protein [Corynebacterium sp. MSK073]WKS60411.1 Mrp/NBP35 family ATP-binding protein [Corynebacterium accolens]